VPWLSKETLAYRKSLKLETVTAGKLGFRIELLDYAVINSFLAS